MVRLVLHAVGQPGMGLLLIGVLGLLILLSGIGLIGLVVHGPFGTPPFARQTLTVNAGRVHLQRHLALSSSAVEG
jgi:hypothetical protein